MAVVAVEQETEVTEVVVAIIPGGPKTEETELSKSVSKMELEAESKVIETDEDYQAVGVFARSVKNMIAEVKAFFEPMKKDSHKAWKTICERENTMLKPLNNAENIIKTTMGEYTAKMERERLQAEEIARRIALEEADAQLEAAAEAEADGNSKAAEFALYEAQAAENLSKTVSIPGVAPPKAAGISQTKDWEITKVDSSKVPVEIAGIELRPVDTAAALRLIRMSKGKTQIPGIEYKEVYKTSIRR